MIHFYADSIELIDYRFSAASVFPSGTIRKDQIREALLDCFPPEIRTAAGEVLFVDAVYKDDLKQFALTNAIPVVKRVDTWGLLLEVFLDTEYSDESKEKDFQLLAACGISREEVNRIRHSVQDVMIAYNFKSMLWEWFHLGLYDLLSAYTGVLTGNGYKQGKKEFRKFYQDAMIIANKGIFRE
ncbi:hypothetical protein MUG84_03405 [Paenibacillus sp. KQZ6P-2]|uniref:Uncharacterized protein n=1 Tax=Paenibacillus mangrovi TaxID=2931978 RepID=A0A9X1WPD3_9BACL|nr:hypothetical protein [Paenibacillus mangrovi]MCJ8010790.1 hypothetical protein [Paenibacillus mangrovi]